MPRPHRRSPEWHELQSFFIIRAPNGSGSTLRLTVGGILQERSDPPTGRPRTMNTNMQGHNHGGKNHLLGMLGIGAVVLVVLLASGSSLRTALPFAALLACPLMMGGMMFMMMRGGNGNQQGNDAPNKRDHDDVTNQGSHDVPETWQDSPNITPPQSPPTATRP